MKTMALYAAFGALGLVLAGPANAARENAVDGEAARAGPAQRTASTAKGDRLGKTTSKTAKPASAETRVADTAATISVSQVKQLSDAIRMVEKGRYSEASLVARSLSNPLGAKLIEWLIVQTPNDQATFERIANFARLNPDWPRMEAINRLAEMKLLEDAAEPGTIIALFKDREPVSDAGRLALAYAQLRIGNRKKSERIAKNAWVTADLTTKAEASAARLLKDVLDDDDHGGRLVRMLYKRKYGPAARAARRLDKGRVALSNAAIAYLKRSRRAERLYKSVPSSLRGQLVLQYARAYYYRRRNKDSTAHKVILAALASDEPFTYPDEWWEERRTLIYGAIGDGKNTVAYKLANRNDFKPGDNGYVQTEFLAGMISMTKLRDTKTALAHFERLYKGATRDSSRAMADYWAGQALRRLGRKAEATKLFERAAIQSRTFYGQLASDALGRKPRRIDFSSTPSATSEAKAALNARELTRVIRLLQKMEADQLIPTFIYGLAGNLKDKNELAALAGIAWDMGQPNLAVRASKIALVRGYDMGGHLYPRNALPKFNSITAKVEPAFVMGLTRQESEFNPTAVSHAGARGLMQLMPATARMVARQHKQRYSKTKLTKDPAYNVMLGAAHLHDLLKIYDGSYILTAAGYNAGPGNVRKWIRAFGDPRDRKVDPLLWIESIPYNETRNYVKRVLKNTVIYRSRLGDEPVGISTDMHRGLVAGK